LDEKYLLEVWKLDEVWVTGAKYWWILDDDLGWGSVVPGSGEDFRPWEEKPSRIQELLEMIGGSPRFFLI
jgi:hypothetical protein